MRIAIDCRMYGASQFSGIGTYIQKLTDELFQLDEKNEYLLFLREPEFSKFNPPNKRVKKALTNCAHYSYAEQTKFVFELTKHKFDLIHYPHFNSPVLFRKKSVCTIHDLTPFFYPGHQAGSGWRRWAYRAVFRSTVAKASQIITVSESTKADIIKYFQVDPAKINVIYEGVDEHFKKIDNYGIINKIKKKFGITKPYIFFVGVWRSHKNIDGLVKAFNLLKKKHQIDCQLVLGGREDLHYTEVRRQIEKSRYKKDIITLGYVADNILPILYSHAELFVLPSFIEGFGLIAVEAQACGCPVASSNTSAMPEVLEGSAAFFAPRNINEMAEKIYQIINNQELKKRLIAKGLENVKRFSWKNCAEKTLEIYNSI